MVSVHTSPLAQPGTGDAGGMNVYVLNTARELARSGVEVEIFTRATSSEEPPTAEAAPGVLVHHLPAGPFEGLSKNDLPTQLCAFTGGLLRAEAHNRPGHYDLIHAHYWLSGQAAWVASERWGVPLVQTFHTLAKVKNARLADGDSPEPIGRVVGEEQITTEADLLIANTAAEADELREFYNADTRRVEVIHPGVDLGVFRPGDRRTARESLGLPADALIVAFVGRIQPAKAPDVLLRGLARLRVQHPALAERIVPVFVGGPSNTDLYWLPRLAADLGLGDRVQWRTPRSGEALAQVYRAADAVAVPSYNESFGLVALEAQATGTPVIAAKVGGLPTAVADGRSGLLVDSHSADDWATALGRLMGEPDLRERLAAGARTHAALFSWQATAEGLGNAYRRALLMRSQAITLKR
ncbi:D-inositol-3-phosphate glycosyltransferase [Glycomyces paridis]|uniref:D-inositol-3-phosphate glycosyltransferase n=1 Tax=Glycomyces paridis TaxID=2126555 RepID=A0A4S8PCQ3_9ACTN|nr:D-inositol-3-phosphate glycosyltransferase [Glycomyces paridis]